MVIKVSIYNKISVDKLSLIDQQRHLTRTSINIMWLVWQMKRSVVRTGQCSMDDKLSEKRLCWLGHVIRMDHQCIPRQALHWEVPGFKRGPGRPRANWRSTVNKDLLRMGFTWKVAEMAAHNTSEWCWSVAQCTAA